LLQNFKGGKDPILLLRHAMRYSGQLFLGREVFSTQLRSVDNNIHIFEASSRPLKLFLEVFIALLVKAVLGEEKNLEFCYEWPMGMNRSS